MKRLSQKYAISSMGPDNKMAVWIKNCETIEVETNDWFNSNRNYAYELATAQGGISINPATGPIGIIDAQPGDTLRIEILNVELIEKGLMFSFPKSGLLGNRITEIKTKVICMENGFACFSDAVKIPLSPMIGTIGTAPLETVPCYLPGRHGGNMDARVITAKSTLYLPVFIDGGGLALGDLHGVMADGEVSEWGLETSGKVTLSIELIKNLSYKWPLLKTEADQYIIVSHENLDTAIYMATEYAVMLIQTKTGLSLEDSISLASLMGHVEICQLVNPLKTIRFRIGRRILPEIF